MTENVETNEAVKEEPVASQKSVKKPAAANKPKPVAEKKVESVTKDEKEIVFSTGNLNWSGVGTLEYGFNVVSKAAAEKWLTLKKVRKATVDEVKEYYGR